MQHKRIVALCVFFSIACFVVAAYCPINSWAAVLELPLENLVAKSDVILVGTVKYLRNKQSVNEPVATEIIVAPENFIKSSINAPEIIVKVFGGEVGDLNLTISTEPVFNKGQKTLLFLKKTNEDNIYRPVNSMQGKYTVGAKNMILENGLALDDFINQIKNYVEE